MRFARLILCAASLGLLAAAPASAEVRFASPGGGPSPPCNPTACDLPTAIAVANPGDQVQMAPGNYLLPFGLLVDKAIDIGGVPEAPPVIEFGIAAEGLVIDNAAAILHDVRLGFAGPAMAYTLTLKTGTVEGVYADGSNVAAGCAMSRGLIRDSVCRDGLHVVPSGAGSYQATITNVTANPVMIGAQSGANLAASITNTLALPDPEGGGPKDGLLINVGMGASAAALLTNSSYNGVDTTLSSGTEFQFTPAGTNGNQTAPPLLADTAGGDFRQLPGSPTIDAGTTAVDPLGALDLSGAARVQPGCTGGTPVPDIGAYEFTPTAACPGGPPATELAKVPSRIGFGKLKLNRAKGVATLAVKLRAAGRLILSGKGIVGRKINSRAARTVSVQIKAKGAKAKALRKRGKVRLQAKLGFIPASAAELPTTKTRSLTLKLQPPRG